VGETLFGIVFHLPRRKLGGEGREERRKGWKEEETQTERPIETNRGRISWRLVKGGGKRNTQRVRK